MARALNGTGPQPAALIRKRFCDRHGWKPWEFDKADLSDINEWLILDDLEDRHEEFRARKEQEAMAKILRGSRGF